MNDKKEESSSDEESDEEEETVKATVPAKSTPTPKAATKKEERS